ncbi:MAG: hypothetical protein AB7T03_00325 [Bacilli bacterium]
MKILFLLAAFFTIAFSDDHQNEFDDEVNRVYSTYRLVDDYENPYYAIKLVHGLVNDQMTYGVSFFSSQAKQYSLKMSYQNQVYDLPCNRRGDINIVALNLKEGSTFSLIVFDYDEHPQSLTRFQNINVISKTEFLTLSNPTTGLGEGMKPLKLRTILSWSPLTIFYFAMLFVFLICALVLIIFYWQKKGFFEKTTDENIDSKNTMFDDLKEEDSPLIQEPILASSFDQKPVWEEEEIPTVVNVKEHLSLLGLNTNYQVMSDGEKFQVMSELIKLRDQKLLSKDDYLMEVMLLWKK